MIEAAPRLFLLLVLASLLVSWGLVHLLHRHAFKNKDTEIAQKNDRIELFKAQRDEAERKLAASAAELEKVRATAQAGAERIAAGATQAEPRPAHLMPDGLVSTTPVEADPAEMSRRLHVGRVAVDTRRVLSDYYLEFGFFAFNGTPAPLRFDGIRGFVSYASTSSAQEGEWVELPPATSRQDNPAEIAPFRGFSIAVGQRVPGDLAPRIEQDLAGGRVLFVFERLDIHLSRAGGGDPIRLPIWERVTCERAKLSDAVMQVIVVRAAGFIG